MVSKSWNLKKNASEINAIPLCLGNISKKCSIDNMNEAGLNWYVYDFSVDYDAISVDDILDKYIEHVLDNYLKKKCDIK